MVYEVRVGSGRVGGPCRRRRRIIVSRFSFVLIL